MAQLMMAGSALAAHGQIRQGQLAEKQGNVQNKIAEYNAQQLERESAARMDAAHLEESRVSRQARLFKGQQRAEFAKSGLSLTEGSPLEVQADTAYQFAMDRNLTLRAGLLDSQRLKNQAGLQRVEGKWAKAYGKEMKTQSYLQAGATILGGGYSASQGMSGGSGNLNTGSSPYNGWAGMNTSSGIGRSTGTGTYYG